MGVDPAVSTKTSHNLIEARRLDIIVIDKKEQKGIIIDIAVPADVRKGGKESEKYQDLKTETGRLWILKMVEVIHVVMGALGSVTKGFDRWIEKLGIPLSVGVMQKKSVLVGNCKDIEESVGNVKKG